LCIILFIAAISSISCPSGKQEKGENTAPFIKRASIIPENPTLGSRVTLRIEATDKEADNINYLVKWYLNGREIGEGLEFTLENAKRDDKIFAEVTPSDGKLNGATEKTGTITIGNTPPQILSSKLKPDTILSATGEITIIGEGFDPDGDSITYFCYWTLDNKRIADTLTTLKLTDLKLKKGSVLTAELYAHDGAAASNVYRLDIETVNSPPVLRQTADSVVYNPENINYPLPIVDPDGDPMTFKLLEGPATAIGIQTFQVLVRASDNDGGYLEARFTLTAPPSQ
jgi:hypothetical protein